MFNSELHSLFPDLANSRCTRTTCLAQKQEQHMLDSILAAVGDENLDIYIKNGSSEVVHADVVKKLGELGIEVKYGNVFRMPENPVSPAEEDFPGNKPAFVQAQKDFVTKQNQWRSLHELLENGDARKVVMMENMAPTPGYIMFQKEKETTKAKPEIQNRPDTSGNSDSPVRPVSPDTSNSPQSPDDKQGVSPATVEKPDVSIKPDLLSTLREKDRTNREEALGKVTNDAVKLLNDTDIPPEELTPFEETLMNFVLLAFLDRRHYEFFGLIEGQTLSEDYALGLFSNLTEEQKIVLKRNFLIKHLTIKNGINKRAALLIELAKHHFPIEMAEVENAHNDEYLKKWAIIKEQIDKIQSENEDLQEVA
jgi:hypothetical protein